MLKAALDAVARGLTVFPVAVGSKVPHHLASYRDAAGVQHGWGETATSDFNRVAKFWTQVDPAANVGVACKQSQILVVDLDQAKTDVNLRGTEWEYMHSVYGPRVNGSDLFDEMAYQAAGADEDYDAYRQTFTVRTGSGGIHLYYRWPHDWPHISQASPVKGVVDVRGNGGQFGGYVLGAGSRTLAGEYVVTENLRVELPPMWIRKLVAEKPKIAAPSRVTGLRQPGALSWSGLVDSVRNAGEGNRNNALHWAARAMYSDRAPLSEAQQVLGAAAREAGLGEFEIQRTIESGYNAQQQKEG